MHATTVVTEQNVACHFCYDEGENGIAAYAVTELGIVLLYFQTERTMACHFCYAGVENDITINKDEAKA